jgi:hypothetical protein
VIQGEVGAAAAPQRSSPRGGRSMALLVLVLGLVVAALGVLGIVAPTRLLGIAQRFATPTGLYAATAIRLFVGAAILLAAPSSRAPGALRLLGIAIVAAGLATPLIGLERSRAFVRWWSARGPMLQRAWGALALVFGLSLCLAVAR